MVSWSACWAADRWVVGSRPVLDFCCSSTSSSFALVGRPWASTRFVAFASWLLPLTFGLLRRKSSFLLALASSRRPSSVAAAFLSSRARRRFGGSFLPSRLSGLVRRRHLVRHLVRRLVRRLVRFRLPASSGASVRPVGPASVVGGASRRSRLRLLRLRCFAGVVSSAVFSFASDGLRLPASLRRRDRHVRLPFWMPSPVAKIWRPSCALTSGRARGRSFIVFCGRWLRLL